MNCCVRCFADAEIINIINNRKIKGDCDFCGCKNTFIFTLGTDSTLSDMFSELLDIYTPAPNLPASFPKENTDLLKNHFNNTWSIFNVAPDSIYRLLISICAEKYVERPELFDYPVGILESQDKDYLDEFSVIKNHHWKDFTGAIKYVNRFHTDYINKNALDLFIRCAIKPYKAGKTFYRARVCIDKAGFQKSEMGAPPVQLASTGRVNPAGISVLYLADSIKTTLHEIRAGVFDYVTIGYFKLKKDIEIIDFTNLDKISPFIAYNAMGIPYVQHAINIEHLKLISQEIAKPLRRHDSVLDYLPTQYISNYIKSKNYEGVEYISTMCKDGFNLAIFDESVFKCAKTTVYDIKSLSYTYDKII
jgi:hypothetical protein